MEGTDGGRDRNQVGDGDNSHHHDSNPTPCHPVVFDSVCVCGGMHVGFSSHPNLPYPHPSPAFTGSFPTTSMTTGLAVLYSHAWLPLCFFHSLPLHLPHPTPTLPPTTTPTCPPPSHFPPFPPALLEQPVPRWWWVVVVDGLPCQTFETDSGGDVGGAGIPMVSVTLCQVEWTMPRLGKQATFLGGRHGGLGRRGLTVWTASSHPHYYHLFCSIPQPPY